MPGGIFESIKPTLADLINETPPLNFSDFEKARLNQLQLAGRLVLKGYEVKTALALAGGPRIAAFYRLVAAYKKAGISGLLAGYSNCGRPARIDSERLQLGVANLALRAVKAVLDQRLEAAGGAGLSQAESSCGEAAGKALLRSAGMARANDEEIASLVLEGLRGGNATSIPAQLLPFIDQIAELAGAVLFASAPGQPAEGGEP